MPPPLALFVALLFIGYLLRRDSREEPKVSGGIWIPTLWLMINGSRQVSQWLDPGVSFAAQRLEEGSPIDQAVYSLLIVAGICVLVRRRVRVGEIVRRNGWIWLFFLYEGLSFLWSDFHFVTFKRWIKALGDVVMVMVLWSELVPARAITATIKRCAYVLIPLSVLFCKYYESLGRAFDSWGQSFYTGVTTNKNMLGYLLFAFGVFFFAAFVSTHAGRHDDVRHGRRSAQVIHLLFLIMIGWLIFLANSKTAALALVAGVAVIIASRVAVVRRHFGICAVAVILFVTVLEMSFSIFGTLAEGAGRDVSLTGRTGLWQTLLADPHLNPLFGVGYASFWLGERLLRYWAMYPTSPPIQAHNGYLEVYLNLGLIGLCLLAGVLWTGLRKIRNRIAPAFSTLETSNDRLLSTFGIGYGIGYLFYNITEATFQGLNILFVIFLILAFHYSQTRALDQKQSNSFTVQRRRRHVEGSAAVQVSR